MPHACAAPPGSRDDEVVLLSVGRLEENKGFHVLGEALAALRDHAAVIAGERWRWVLVGDGPYRGVLTRAIAAAGLTQRTLLTGRVDDRTLHAWYEAAHLFVHPTLYEGSSLVTLEAMAHRRAVVATNAGGLPDKIVTGRNGWLVPAGDPSALAAAVSGALGPTRGPGRSRRARPDGRRAGVFVGGGRGRDHPTLREPSRPRAKLTQFFLGLYAPRNGKSSARHAPHRRMPDLAVLTLAALHS